MLNINLEQNITIINVIYNENLKVIYVYGFTNLTTTNITPCKIFTKYKTSSCNIKGYYRKKTYFMYELYSSIYGKPKILCIKRFKFIITHSLKNNNKNTVCITKMINFTALNYFIQMIELYRYFGISKFFIYYTSSSNKMLKILNYYIKKDIITIIKWNYSYEISFMKKYVYGQKWKYNDCYYRNAGNKNLLIFTDLDEIIYPLNGRNIYDMLYNYDRMKSDIYEFRTRIYMKDYSTLKYDRYIHIVEDFDLFNLHNSCIYPKRFLRKYIINNFSYLKIIDIHDIEDSEKRIKLSYVPLEYGFIRHSRRVRADLYRKCNRWIESNDKPYIVDMINKRLHAIKQLLF